MAVVTKMAERIKNCNPSLQVYNEQGDGNFHLCVLTMSNLCMTVDIELKCSTLKIMEIFTWVCCSRSSSLSLLHLEKVKTFGKDGEEKIMLAINMIM